MITPNIVCELRLLLTIAFCWTSSPLISQDQPIQNQQAENLPEAEFRILHADDFQGEISPTITVTQGVMIKEGTVSLPGKSRLTHRFNKQSQAIFDFNFGDRPFERETRFGIRLSNQASTGFQLAFSNIGEDDPHHFSVNLLQFTEEGGETDEKPIKKATLRIERSSRVKLAYSFGLLTLSVDKQRQLIGYYKHPTNAIDSLALVAEQNPIHIDSFQHWIDAAEAPDLSPEQVAQLAEADQQNKQLMEYYRGGKFSQAAQCGEAVLKIRRKVLGATHRDYAASLNNLAALYYNMGEYEKTSPLFLESAEIRKAKLGRLHPEYAQSLNNSAALKNMLGDYTGAIKLFGEASAIWKQVLGSQHYEYATSLHNLARCYSEIGQYATAENLYQESLQIVKDNYGDDHPEFATSLNNLALLYELMGDFERAEPLYQQCKEIRSAALGEQHPAYANVLNNLGTLYRDQGKYALARTFLTESLEAHRAAYGNNHTIVATSLNNLALLHQKRKEVESAKKLYAEASKIVKEKLGSEHPRYADILINQGNLNEMEGLTQEAEEDFLAALRIREKVFGGQHPDYAATLLRLATFYSDTGKYNQAKDYSRDSILLQRRQLDRNAIAQSARQQLANQRQLRPYLDFRLTDAVEGRIDPAIAAEEMWQWKGSVTRRQKAYRLIANTPSLKPLYVELQSVTQQLSALARKTPPAPSKNQQDKGAREKWENTFDRLSQRREHLEREIAAQSDTFKRITNPITVQTVQSLLEPKTVFVDLLQYSHRTSQKNVRGSDQGDTRFLAFVIPKQGEVSVVPLGDAARLKESIEQFRRAFQGKPLTGKERLLSQDASQLIRRDFWQPIEEHLLDADTVLISSDTTVSTLPLNAIPGKNQGTYLIEDYRIATLPMVQQLEEIKSPNPNDLKSGKLLVVGDINYDLNEPITDPSSVNLSTSKIDSTNSDVSSLASRREWQELRDQANNQFSPLAGFKKELEVVESIFRSDDSDIITLSGAKATKSSFLQKSGSATILHVITHGYFASASPSGRASGTTDVKQHDSTDTNTANDSSVEQTIKTFAPGLLSGLAFAGANQSSKASSLAKDGILRASEIEVSSLNQAELVVLSACETGLGQVTSGEGITGLQRAFHIAGAKCVVASLWKVDDRATVELMEQFYLNLIEKKQPRIDAMRNAQLTMLDRYDPTLGKLRGLGQKPVQRPVDPDLKTEPTPHGLNHRLDPRYWAAFQISGR